MASQQLSALGKIVQRHDPDRFFTVLFAPSKHRETLFLLYAFNHELARANEVAREPFAALIRLQWWREVVEGARRRHEMAEPLGVALEAGLLDQAELLRMVGAREAEAEGIEDMAGLETFLQDGPGSLMVAAGQALGMDEAAALRSKGAACGVVTLMRNLRDGTLPARSPLPAGLAADEPTTMTRLADMAQAWLSNATVVPRTARAAVLPAVLAQRKVSRAVLATTLADRIAMMLAAWR